MLTRCLDHMIAVETALASAATTPAKAVRSEVSASFSIKAIRPRSGKAGDERDAVVHYARRPESAA